METWRNILVAALALNAVLGFGYRAYRLTKGGPLGDVVGQAILGLVLAGLAVGVAADVEWTRWGALVYSVLFSVVVMPLWTLAVLIPMKPRPLDYTFTGVYWASLAVIGIGAIAL